MNIKKALITDLPSILPVYSYARKQMALNGNPTQWGNSHPSVEALTSDIENGNLYIADFCANAIARVSPDGKVTRIAQSPDTDGLNGELDQPGEPIIWDGKIIVSCFDLVTGPGKVNTAHEMPATMSELDLE